AALIDDPVAVAADAGPADGVILMEGDELRLGLAGGVLANDVGRRAEKLADVIEELAVGAPHGGVVLAVESGERAVVGAVGVANPDVVAGRAAVAFAVPAPRAADVGDLVALG